MKKIVVLEKENEELYRDYWRMKSPEECLSAVEFLREQFYVIQGFASVPSLAKTVHIAKVLIENSLKTNGPLARHKDLADLELLGERI